MTSENEPAVVKIIATNSESRDGGFFEVYIATLDFLARLALPGVILFLLLHFGDDFKEALEGLKVSSIETPVGKIEFVDEVVAGLMSDDPAQNQQALQTIEEEERVVALEIQAGVRREIPTQGEDASTEEGLPEVQQTAGWESVLGISWVKPNDWLGRTYFLSVENAFFVWPVEIDVGNNRAKFIVNDSRDSRSAGAQILPSRWVKEGDSIEFEFDNRQYRLNLVDIRNAGRIKSKATYISVDRKL